jgi:biotin carboxylase
MHNGDVVPPLLRVPESAALMKKILVVCPTQREHRDLPLIAEALNYQLVFEDVGGDYFDNPLLETGDAQALDIIALIEDLVHRYRDAGLRGVTSAVGYPGMSVASIVAERLGLPGPDIECVLLCEHKYYSRIAQQTFVPAATPSFQLLDPQDAQRAAAAIDFPLFVKPVKANFSINANRVANEQELRETLRTCALPQRFIKPFNDLLRAYTDYEHDASHLLAESLLEGAQVSLEGCMFRGKARVLGIVDALMYPGTISFERFVYPSRLSEKAQHRMARIAESLMVGIGYDNALFNIELMYNPRDESIFIIEVNPKIASQFADLFEKVDGTSSYAPLLKVAAGDAPTFARGKGRFKLAASCVLRTFADKRVLRVPSPQAKKEALALFPEARIEICVAPGKLLSDGMQDGKSYRYALINLGADSEADLNAKLETCRKLLDFQFAPI